MWQTGREDLDLERAERGTQKGRYEDGVAWPRRRTCEASMAGSVAVTDWCTVLDGDARKVEVELGV